MDLGIIGSLPYRLFKFLQGLIQIAGTCQLYSSSIESVIGTGMRQQRE
jgi:hypothetical protein